jgi:hypothetical protein
MVAIAYEDEVEEIKSALSKFEGRMLVSRINNIKAKVEVLG